MLADFSSNDIVAERKDSVDNRDVRKINLLTEE